MGKKITFLYFNNIYLYNKEQQSVKVDQKVKLTEAKLYRLSVRKFGFRRLKSKIGGMIT